MNKKERKANEALKEAQAYASNFKTFSVVFRNGYYRIIKTIYNSGGSVLPPKFKSADDAHKAIKQFYQQINN